MKTIDTVCDVLATCEAESFLRLMRELYLGRFADQPLCKLAVELDLWRGTELSPLGYLVGNVAKEYCNWLDNNRQMPVPCPDATLYDGGDVVDLGCSFGRWLWHFRKNARSAIGLEMQSEYKALGLALAKRESVEPPTIITGSVDGMDQYLAPSSADFVFSRLVFNHVKIRNALKNVGTILRKSGTFWLQVEPLSAAARGAFRNRVFALINTKYCELTGHQLAIRRKGRMHTVHRFAYPRIAWWKLALVRSGFTNVIVVSEKQYTFLATR